MSTNTDAERKHFERAQRLLELEWPSATTDELVSVREKYAARRREREEQFLEALAARVAKLLIISSDASRVPMPVVLVSEAEAARVLDISVNALRHRRQRGRVPPGAFVKHGRRVKYRVEVLRSWSSTKRKS